jgi:ribosome-binding factor A
MEDWNDERLGNPPKNNFFEPIIPPFRDSDFKTMEGRRSDKVADLIHKEVSELFVKTVKDPRIGMITITKVTVTADCRSARIHFSVPGSVEERERSKQGLDSAKGYIRRELARRLNLHHTPEILFQFDPSIEYAIHMAEVIESLKKEEEDRDED